MTSMLCKVSMLLFLLSTGGFYTSVYPETFNMDPYLEESFKCFWHVACNLSEILKIKEIADQIKEPQAEYIVTEVTPHLAERLRILTSIQDIESNDVWENKYAEQACALSKEDQSKLLSELYSEFVKHFTQICQDVRKLDQCEAVNQANKMYHAMETEMISREECYISSHKFNFPQM